MTLIKILLIGGGGDELLIHIATSSLNNFFFFFFLHEKNAEKILYTYLRYVRTIARSIYLYIIRLSKCLYFGFSAQITEKSRNPKFGLGSGRLGL